MTVKPERAPAESYTINGKEHPVHDAAKAFPLLDGSELESFVADVGANGIREPVVLWRGNLLDGRNRAEAGNQLKVPIPVRQLDPDVDPYSYVLSANRHRRHQTPEQLAMSCAKIHAEWTAHRSSESRRRAAEAAEPASSDTTPGSTVDAAGADRASAPTGQSSPSAHADPVSPPSTPTGRTGVLDPPAASSQSEGTRRASPPAPPRNRKALAQQMGASPDKTSRAARVRESAPDLEAPVLDGTLSVKDAEEMLKLSPEERQLAVEDVRTGKARRPSKAAPRPSDNNARPPGPQASPGASPQVAGAGAAADERPDPVPADTRSPEAVIASLRAALGDIDFAVFESTADAEALGAKAYQRDAEAATAPSTGVVTGGALLAKPNLSAIRSHGVLAPDRLSVVVLKPRATQPPGVTDDGTVHGRMWVFVIDAPQPPQAFFEAVGSWGRVAPCRQVRPAPSPAPVTPAPTGVQAVYHAMCDRLWRKP